MQGLQAGQQPPQRQYQNMIQAPNMVPGVNMMQGMNVAPYGSTAMPYLDPNSAQNQAQGIPNPHMHSQIPAGQVGDNSNIVAQ
jgi:hypothetical protein